MAPDSVLAFPADSTTFWARGGVAPAEQSFFRPIRIGSVTGSDSHVTAVRCDGNRLLATTTRGLEWISNSDLSSGVFALLPGEPSRKYSASGLFPLDEHRVLVEVSSYSPTFLAGIAVCDLAATTCQAMAVQDDPPHASIGLVRAGQALVTTTHYSTDSGASWQRPMGLPPGVRLRAILERAGHVYIGTDAGIYKSVDQGATYQLLAGSPSFTGPGVAPRYLSISALGKSDTAIFAAEDGEFGALASIYKSTDGGASFTKMASAGLTAFNIRGFAKTPAALWAATSGGVFRSSDDGTYWSAESKGLLAPTVHGLAAGNGAAHAIARGEASDIFRTTDDGRTWSAAQLPLRLMPGPPVGEPLASIAARGSTAIVADSANKGVLRTLDSGASWVVASSIDSSAFAPVTGLAMTDSAVFKSDCCGILRSPNLGAGWSQTNTPLLTEYGFPPPVAIGRAVVFAYDSVVYRSLDDGNTWLAGPRTQGVTGLLASSAGALLAGGVGGIVLRSDDLGVSWHRLPGNVPTEYPPIPLHESAAGLFVGTDLGLFVSHDGGATFGLFDRELEGVHVQSLAATETAVYVGTQDHGVLTYSLPRRLQRLVPIILDVDTGRAHYTTELSLTNRGTSRASLTFLYTASLGSGGGSVTDTIPAGQQLVIPDAVAYLRERGLAIPTVGEQAGTLLVTFEGMADSGAASVLARTTAQTSTPQPGGRAGLAYLAVDPDTASTPVLEVYGLRSTPSDRSNVAVYNAKSESVTFSVTAFSGDGSGASAEVAALATLPAYGWTQYNRVLDAVGFSNGWVEIRRLSATGALGAYGVINDNVTNDGSFIEATQPVARPLYVNVPVLVESSSFSSELVLTNASDEPATFALRYVEALSPEAGAGGTASLVLPARTQRILPNAIGALRSLSVPVGPAGQASYAGALRVSAASGGSPGRLFAGARTASPSAAGGGFGLFAPAVLAGDEGFTSAYLYSLRADVNNRSNVAAANTGSSAAGGSITLLFEAFDGDAGGALRGTSSLTLAPGQWGQISGILGNAGVHNGWVRVSRTSGTAPWIAYGVVNDGGVPGQRTGDGAYVPMERP